ncbi:MAG: hypothetical protein ACK58U_04255 [Rubrivivax sp.]|jgi:hypothetical protein
MEYRFPEGSTLSLRFEGESRVLPDGILGDHFAVIALEYTVWP